MFNIGFSEMIFLAVIALIFIGPKELPQLARVLGRFLNELKRNTESLKEEFKVNHLESHITDIKEDIKKNIAESTSSIQSNSEQTESTKTSEIQRVSNEQNESRS